MEEGFYITWDTIIKAGTILGALGVIIGLIVKGVHWVDEQKEQTTNISKLSDKHNADIDMIQEELTMLTYGTLACLKGLQEKGCNGPVTEAIDKIEKYINKKAHNQDNADT